MDLFVAPDDNCKSGKDFLGGESWNVITIYGDPNNNCKTGKDYLARDDLWMIIRVGCL